jgi:hypothetical protein
MKTSALARGPGHTRRVLGSQHPATLDSEHELAIMLAAPGSKPEARSMLLFAE